MNKRPKVLGIHDDGKLEILGIYDDGGKTIDRYTVVYNQVEREVPGKNGRMVKLYAAVGMNAAPFHPQGFGQHCTAMLGRHLGKKITFEQLPDDCRKMVLKDLEENHMKTTEKNHAIENAKNWLRNIVELTAKLNTKNDREREDAEREIQESVLSVCVRDSRFLPVGTPSDGPDEFEILLSTGGPALRIIGQLDRGMVEGEPRLEYQDWGTPWTMRPLTKTERMALIKFIGVFYFGE